MSSRIPFLFVSLAILILFVSAFADSRAFAGEDEPKVYSITIKNNVFIPDILEVPAGKRIKLEIHNQDASAEEFESYRLNREKIIGGNSKGVVFIGPLEAGEYPFFGEFHPDTAQGKIVAK